MILGMIVGAFLYAAGLATAAFYLKRQKPPLPPPAKADGYDRYRNPATGLLSTRMVDKQLKAG